MYYTNKDIRIAMIENDISNGELAKEMGFSESHMSKVIRTEPIRPMVRRRILNTIERMKENKI